MGGIARIPATIAIASLMRSAKGAEANGEATRQDHSEKPWKRFGDAIRDTEVRFRSQKLERLLNTPTWTRNNAFGKPAGFTQLKPKSV